MFVLCAILAQMVVKLHANWDGATSEGQHTRSRFHESSGLIVEATLEAKRLVKRAPTRFHTNHTKDSTYEPIEWPKDSLAWHLQARDLITLKTPTYSIDADSDEREITALVGSRGLRGLRMEVENRLRHGHSRLQV